MKTILSLIQTILLFLILCLLISIHNQADAQIREPERQVIFYASLSSQTIVPAEGAILFYNDSIRAFGFTWDILKKEELHTNGSKIYLGIFTLMHDTTHATVFVINKSVVFDIKGIRVFLLKQLPHTGRKLKQYGL